MNGHAVERIETTIDTVAATLFAAAAAFAVASMLHGSLLPSQWGAITAAVLIIGYAGCLGVLRRIPVANQHLALPIFAALPIEPVQVDELVLTDADRLHPASTPSAQPNDPLVLDDILAELDPDSRVVRLFDPSAMPTPGQLQARIDRHLDEGSSPDASQALFEALAQLRRSIA